MFQKTPVRKNMLVVRCSLDEIEAIKRLAIELHITSSDVVRLAIAEQLKRIRSKGKRVAA